MGAAFDQAVIETAARLACDDIYDPVTPQVFGKLYRIGESVCGTVQERTEIGDVFYVVMQGTELEEQDGDGRLHFSLQGWVADFDCAPFAHPGHPELGLLHGGFHRNLPVLMDALVPDIAPGARVIVTGHSKGAGEGALLAALLKLKGIDVAGVILFACPHPGCADFAQWMERNMPGISYRNAPRNLRMFGDPVPLVPFAPYVAAYPFTYIDCPPAGIERAMSVAWHRGGLYVQGASGGADLRTSAQ